MKKIFLSITIDTECDKEFDWKVKRPLSFDNTRNQIKSNLLPVFNEFGAIPTYLLSPEVIKDEESAEVFKSFGNSVELGTHLHSEFIEPEANLDTDNTDLYQKDLTYEVEKRKLENLTNLFFDTFGYKPLSFRAGRYGISQRTFGILEKLGYKVDSSVTPDMQWKNKNKFKNSLNFFGAPYQPYYPDNDDFRKPGKMEILQSPVSVVNYKLSSLPSFLKRKIRLNNRYQHILFNYLTNFNKPVMLRPTNNSLEKMIALSNYLIKSNEASHIFLCMMFHSNEYCIGASPYSMTKEKVKKNISNLERYLCWLKNQKNISFTKLSDTKLIYDNMLNKN